MGNVPAVIVHAENPHQNPALRHPRFPVPIGVISDLQLQMIEEHDFTQQMFCLINVNISGLDYYL